MYKSFMRKGTPAVRTAYAKCQRNDMQSVPGQLQAVLCGWIIGYEMGQQRVGKDEGLTDQSMACNIYPIQQ